MGPEIRNKIEPAIKKLQDKDVKVRRMIKCANPNCKESFPERGPKKYHSPKCQWTVYNEAHPIIRNDGKFRSES